MMNAPTAHEYATAAAAGHPRSKNGRLRWYRSVMPFSAGPRFDVRSAVTTPSPTNPMPTRRPDFRAFENFMPMRTKDIYVMRILLYKLCLGI